MTTQGEVTRQVLTIAQFARWIAITVFDILTEVLLFLYAGLALHKIQISLQKKLMVGVTLESRIL
jgi:hypothetical protein